MSEKIPEFAVVGRVNMGKSSVIATLLEIDDNELIRISPTPGETTMPTPYPVKFGKRECVRFIDTPGFSQAVEAMREIQKIHGEGTPGREALRKFVEQEPGFADEKNLLRPLLDGAGVLYVVDPSKPLRDDFLAEMEILRWTGRPRLAVLNLREGKGTEHEELWREKLGSAFNLVRTFDAHHAKYEQRLLLMKSLLEIEERNRAKLEETISLIEMEWEERRLDAAEIIRDFLAAALKMRAQARIDEKDESLPSRRHKKEEELKIEYFEKLKKLEKTCFSELLRIYRHHLLKVESAAENFREIDLESVETWMKWGLSRTQLTLIAAATGAAGGAVVDISTGGLTHGLGTLIGGIGGAGAAWFKGGMLPDLKVDMKGGLKLSTGETKEMVIGPPASPNFPWILLDGVLVRYGRILEKAHGRHDVEILEASDEEGYTKHFPPERRKVLGKWFAECAKGNRPVGKDVDTRVLLSLEESLGDVERVLESSGNAP
ncbi:DUF3482 domain-containing protein [Luteolibacter algae]|uniref:DUF3482 domain-containing protein n=1 Tax=Luteolibacter algae TaxID=454151 RepID=A0ABW5D896_9BACT